MAFHRAIWRLTKNRILLPVKRLRRSSRFPFARARRSRKIRPFTWIFRVNAGVKPAGLATSRARPLTALHQHRDEGPHHRGARRGARRPAVIDRRPGQAGFGASRGSGNGERLIEVHRLWRRNLDRDKAGQVEDEKPDRESHQIWAHSIGGALEPVGEPRCRMLPTRRPRPHALVLARRGVAPIPNHSNMAPLPISAGRAAMRSADRRDRLLAAPCDAGRQADYPKLAGERSLISANNPDQSRQPPRSYLAAQRGPLPYRLSAMPCTVEAKLPEPALARMPASPGRCRSFRSSGGLFQSR
jgi:hypothetical protein